MATAPAPPARLTFVPVPFTPSGISIPQLAKRLGATVDTIWYPIRPNSRTVDVNEATGIAIVLKSAFADALSKLSVTSPYEPFSVENTNPQGSNGDATRADGGVAATAMISNRLRMIRAMRGIGDGRKMQLNFRFIPPQYVCFVQAPSNSKLVLSKASKDAMGGEDPLYALAMVRAATYEELLAEGCIFKPAAAETTTALTPNNDSGGGVVSDSGAAAVGQKRSRDERGSDLGEGEATVAPAGTKREKRKVSALTKIMQTPEGAFLSDQAGISTHSELWLSVKSNVSANGLHKPPLHKSKLFYPAGVSATSPVPPTTTTTKYNTASNTFSSDANNSAKRVVINNVSWQMLEPHCVSTSFNFGLSSGPSVGSYSAAAQLSTSKIAAIIVDGAFLSSHRYFRGTAHATAALMMGSAPILASGCNNENSTVGDATAAATTAESGPSAMAVATAFESAVRQHHGLSESISLVVGGTREAPFSPQTVGPSGVSHFQQTASIFQQRCRELAMQGFRVVLFASAPELHHADQESIEDKLTSIARCVASLVTAPSSLPMPPITLMVSVASAVTSSFLWGMGYQQNESAATGHQSSCSTSVSVNAKMLWRAFVRHMNQNKFPSVSESLVVSLVGRKLKRGAGGNDKIGEEEEEDDEDDGDRAESTTALSDVASFATAPIVLPQGGRYNPPTALTTALTSPDPSKTHGALKTLSFLTSSVDAIISREFVSEDGKALRLVSTKAFLEGRAVVA